LSQAKSLPVGGDLSVNNRRRAVIPAEMRGMRRPAHIEFDKQAGYLYSVTVPEELPMIYETTYSNARAHLASLMDQVTDTREPILIRRRGAESVALVAADELAGWMETAYLLRSPKNAQRLLDGSRRAAAGEGIPLSVEQLRVRCADSLPAPGPGVSTRSTVWSIESNQPAYDSSQPGTTTEQRPEPALPLARYLAGAG
jgi:antitoxin YefM